MARFNVTIDIDWDSPIIETKEVVELLNNCAKIWYGSSEVIEIQKLYEQEPGDLEE